MTKKKKDVPPLNSKNNYSSNDFLNNLSNRIGFKKIKKTESSNFIEKKQNDDASKTIKQFFAEINLEFYPKDRYFLYDVNTEKSQRLRMFKVSYPQININVSSAKFHFEKGNKNLKNQNYYEAIIHFRIASDICTSLNKFSTLGLLYYSLANAYSGIRKYIPAFKAIEIAHKISIKLNSNQELNYELIKMDLVKKIEYIKQNFPNTPEGKIFETTRLAQKDFLLNKWNSAMKYYTDILKIALEVGLLDEAVVAYFNLGNISKQTNDKTEAMRFYEKGFSLGKKIYDQKYLISIYTAMKTLDKHIPNRSEDKKVDVTTQGGEKLSFDLKDLKVMYFDKR